MKCTITFKSSYLFLILLVTSVANSIELKVEDFNGDSVIGFSDNNIDYYGIQSTTDTLEKRRLSIEDELTSKAKKLLVKHVSNRKDKSSVEIRMLIPSKYWVDEHDAGMIFYIEKKNVSVASPLDNNSKSIKEVIVSSGIDGGVVLVSHNNSEYLVSVYGQEHGQSAIERVKAIRIAKMRVFEQLSSFIGGDIISSTSKLESRTIVFHDESGSKIVEDIEYFDEIIALSSNAIVKGHKTHSWKNPGVHYEAAYIKIK